jgi:hypothetical protein
MEQMLSLATHMSSDHLQSFGEAADKQKALLGASGGADGGPGGPVLPVQMTVVQVVQVQGLSSTESPANSAEHPTAAVASPQQQPAGKKLDNKLSSGSGESSLVPTGPNPVGRTISGPPVPLAEEVAVVPLPAAPAAGKHDKGKGDEKKTVDEEKEKEMEQSFGVEGPTEAKDNVWTVTYTWRYRRSFFRVLETFTIADYKIKKLKRSRA